MKKVTVTVTLDEDGEKRRHSKKDIRHWRKKVYHTVASRDGVRYTSPNWHAAFCHQGKRASLTMETTDREEAAGRARDVFIFLKQHGWEKMFQLCRPYDAEDRLAILYGNGAIVDQSPWNLLRLNTKADKMIAAVKARHSGGAK